jgi:hypothetical protein
MSHVELLHGVWFRPQEGFGSMYYSVGYTGSDSNSTIQ